MNKLFNKGVTLIELMVVLLIVSLLSTIAVGVYTKEVLRAKVARTRAEIRTMEVAINRYQIDVGQFPPSSTGTAIAPSNLDQLTPAQGCGYMQLALRGSLNGNMYTPLSTRWEGPYLDWDDNKLGTLTGGALTTGLSRAQIQFLDPFGSPYYYIQYREYSSLGGARLPSDHPYYSTETYYNPATFQILSQGPNGTTGVTVGGLIPDSDDIVNWESPNI
ncbi:prepilin-type N-terminal cleavage/methylation domain-containing protein [bacterium]|nr:prepilin-type N-terminal cleavage/methylation domain-containing protein [bacterium]